MKYYQKDCKNMKQVNSFLKSIGLEEWEFSVDSLYEDFDFDSWMNEKETKGLSILVTKNFEVYVTKYTKKDIDALQI